MVAPAEGRTSYACRACEASGPEVFRKRGFVVAECRGCGSRFVPAEHVELPRYDDEAYFAGGSEACGYGGYLADRELVLANFARRVRWLAPLASGRRLLDVGAAYGLLLEAARRSGFEVLGVEPVGGCAEFARRELGVEILRGKIEDLELPPSSFDVVTMLDVIEHLAAPLAAVRRVRSLLRPGGLLVVETGDAGGLLARLCGPRWYFYDPPQHVTFFRRQGLAALLERAGFSVPVAVGRLGRSVSLRNFAFQLGRALGPGPGGRASRALAGSPLGRLRLRVPDRGNAFALAVRRVG